MKTLHKNLIEAVRLALNSTFFEGRYAEHVIEYIIKSNKKWGGRDRKFIAETTYNIVRNWRLLHEINGTYQNQNPSQLDRIITIYFTMNSAQLPEWMSENFIEPNYLNSKLLQFKDNQKIRESVPDWLDDLGVRELGSRWGELLPCLNKQADVVIRVNTLKTTKEDLIEFLKTENVEVEEIPAFAEALRLVKRTNLFMTEAYKKGLFEVQDASSQLVAPSLNAEPGMRVIDACAGSGGKALHLATLMQNKGRLLALDISNRKLGELGARARRNGISIIEMREIDSTKVIKRLEASADRLLLDVPCSGSGVLRRHPDTKWKLSPEVLNDIHGKQAELLQSYSRMLKPGGIMVYSTCSIFPTENEVQIRKFLELNDNFTLLSDQKIPPDQNGFDGFYIAKLYKNFDTEI